VENFIVRRNLARGDCGCAGGFRLRQRALHVYAESLRVPLFQKACNERGSDSEKLEKLGKLMDESQASCRYVTGAR
jgi:galactokinase